MSEVILDTITGKSTATTITIGSTPVVSASANSMTIRGEGSNQTSIQQGLAKCWSVNFTLASSSGSAEDSLNLASTTDNSTGDASCNFTNNYASKGFTSHAMASNHGDTFETTKYADATTFARLQLYRQSTTSVSDNAFSLTTHGDLA